MKTMNNYSLSYKEAFIVTQTLGLIADKLKKKRSNYEICNYVICFYCSINGCFKNNFSAIN